MAPGLPVGEMQEGARIPLHRSRNVDQHHQGRAALLALPEGKPGRVGLARHRAQRAAQIDMAPRGRRTPAADQRAQRQFDALGQAPGLGELGRAHRLEIGHPQAFLC